MLHPDVPRWAALNATGRLVAELCDGAHTAEQIVEVFASRWRLDAAALRADVLQCLLDLGRAGFFSTDSDDSEIQAWSLQINLTAQCNLSCRHCGVATESRQPKRLNTDTIHSLIDSAIDDGVDSIAFSGGEPLLRPDCLDLVRHAAQRVKVSLATNATLIDHEVAALVAELGIAVQVSLDGATAATHDAIRGRGAYDRAWRGIDHLAQLGASDRLGLNVTLMRSNLPEVWDMLSLAARRGVRSVRLVPVQRLGRAARDWAELAPSPSDLGQTYRLLYSQPLPDGVRVNRGFPGLVLEPPVHRMWCRLGQQLVVDAQGDIYPCSLLTHPRFRLGDIETVSLDTALRSPQLRQLATLVQRRPDEIEDCRNCAWRRFCQSNCPASIWLEQGSWHAVDGLCDLRRELYRTLILAQAGMEDLHRVCL